MRIAVPLGRVVQQRRISMGLNQETLAERAGVHRTYLSDVERGTRNVTLGILERLAESLGMELSELFALAEGRTTDHGRAVRKTELHQLIAEISDQLQRLRAHTDERAARSVRSGKSSKSVPKLTRNGDSKRLGKTSDSAAAKKRKRS